MVCLSSQGPNSARLLRFGSRLAGRLNRNWYAVYVQTPAEEATRIDAKTQRLLADTLTLANQLGATVFTFKGDDIADTIVRFATEYRVGQIVIGKPHPIPVWRRFLGHRSVAEQLIFKASHATIVVIDADAPETVPVPEVESAMAAKPASSNGQQPTGFEALLNRDNVLIFDEPVTRQHLFGQLVAQIEKGNAAVDTRDVLDKLNERESRGSTFLNEGIGLPHARVAGLSQPAIAIGVTHEGILDSPTANAIAVVFLLLTPLESTSTHLQLLAAIGRRWQNRELRKLIESAHTREQVIEALRH